MIENTADVQTGMTVYAADGQEIGKISHVWRDVPMTDTGSGSVTDTTGTPQPGITQTETVATPSMSAAAIPASGYFEVDHGGILGIGSTKLYVPFSAVEDVVRGDCLTLSCSTEECDRLFAQKPANLAEERTSEEQEVMPPLV